MVVKHHHRALWLCLFLLWRIREPGVLFAGPGRVTRDTPGIGRWLQVLESVQDVEQLPPLPQDILLLLRQRLRQERRYDLADALLEILRPRLEAAGLRLEDDRDGQTRLVPHKTTLMASHRKAALAAKAARSYAEEALKQSLQADTEEEALAAADAAALGVHQAFADSSDLSGLKGRQASDLALSLALAGCDESQIFDQLGTIAEKELLGRQRSLVTVQQMLERLATAGYRQQDYPGVFKAGLTALKRLSCPSSSNLRDLEVGNYSLHSPRPLLWLFRHSTRQGRRCIPPRASKVHEAVERLSQSSQPLVIDLGCGFGASSLGLAQGGHAVLAVDASAHCIRYATALRRRWQLPQSQVSFVQCAAEDALAAVLSVEMAAVKWILINFPTPFAAPESDGAREEMVTSGNSHLPETFDSADFMANMKMLEDARQCLLERGCSDGAGLLVQSNVEDVAVMLRQMAEANGWETVMDPSMGTFVAELQASQWQPRRQQQFAAAAQQRAKGPGWLTSSPLPRLARTETEAYYTAESLAIHRAAALNISPYDMLPEELESIQPHQVALITLEEPRLLRLRQNRAAEMKAQKRSMLLEDDYAEPARVRKDLELTAELQSFNPQWREAVDMTYLSPEECAAVLIRQVKQDRDAAALRLQ
eukprot:symbB.v1.2.028672.t4/scaffold3061.1/size64423/6